MSIKLVMLYNHLVLYCPLLPLPSISPSIRVFSHKWTLPIWWPKYWSFSFSISPSNEYSGLISFGIDWLDLVAVQGTLRREEGSGWGTHVYLWQIHLDTRQNQYNIVKLKNKIKLKKKKKKSLLQHHSSKASVVRCSPSFWSNSHIHTWLLRKP